MHDLQKLEKECIKELKSACIPIRKDKITAISSACLDDSMGLCEGVWEKDGYCFVIKIKEELLNDDVDTMDLKEAVIHELIHTCPRCLSHGETWRRYAVSMNEKYGYSLMEEKDDDAVFHKKKPVLHKAACPVCGAFYNFRDSGLWENAMEASGFICSFCGSEYQTIF